MCAGKQYASLGGFPCLETACKVAVGPRSDCLGLVLILEPDSHSGAAFQVSERSLEFQPTLLRRICQVFTEFFDRELDDFCLDPNN